MNNTYFRVTVRAVMDSGAVLECPDEILVYRKAKDLSTNNEKLPNDVRETSEKATVGSSCQFRSNNENMSTTAAGNELLASSGTFSNEKVPKEDKLIKQQLIADDLNKRGVSDNSFVNNSFVTEFVSQNFVEDLLCSAYDEALSISNSAFDNNSQDADDLLLSSFNLTSSTPKKENSFSVNRLSLTKSKSCSQLCI